MSKAHSTRRPKKPHADFPLFKHARGYWAKKIGGKLRYFGRIDADPDGTAAINQYLNEKDDWLAGRDPRQRGEGFTVCDLVNAFCIEKERQVAEGKITRRTFVALRTCTCEMIAGTFGLNTAVQAIRADDFGSLRDLMIAWAPSRRALEVSRIRSVFNFALAAGYIDKPVSLATFKAPDRKQLDAHREKSEEDGGLKAFEAAEVHLLLARARAPMRAMILLGLNCGFGNNDLGTLRWRHIDLAGGWVEHRRPKTGIKRRCPLWPETVAALELAREKRPNPAGEDYADHVFLTRSGYPFTRMIGDEWRDSLGSVFYNLIERAGISRGRRSFYALRHTTETVGSGACDQVALDAIMGHRDRSMATVYRERIDDARLLKVSTHIRTWLFGEGGVR